MGALDYFSDLFEGVTKRKQREPLQTVEIEVKIDCDGCERKVKRALSSMSGVKTVDIDRKMNKVTVSGYVEEKNVLKKVKGTGKRAEVWPYVRYNSMAHPFSSQMYDKRAPSGYVKKESFNNISNNNGDDDFFTMFFTMFGEEDPNSCTIM
eukprot:PITA_33146